MLPLHCLRTPPLSSGLLYVLRRTTPRVYLCPTHRATCLPGRPLWTHLCPIMPCNLVAFFLPGALPTFHYHPTTMLTPCLVTEICSTDYISAELDRYGCHTHRCCLPPTPAATCLPHLCHRHPPHLPLQFFCSLPPLPVPAFTALPAPPQDGSCLPRLPIQPYGGRFPVVVTLTTGWKFYLLLPTIDSRWNSLGGEQAGKRCLRRTVGSRQRSCGEAAG